MPLFSYDSITERTFGGYVSVYDFGTAVEYLYRLAKEYDMEDLSKLYEGCRTYRRFQQKPLPVGLLQELAETARKRSSAMNQQALRYVVVSSPDAVAKVQPCLHWAASLPKEIGTPKPGEQPVAFIVVLGPAKATTLSSIDEGIALDAMAITAWQQGVGSCILYSVNRKQLAGVVPVPEGFAISTVLALGYPAHKSTLTVPDDEHGLHYYVDENRDYHVPKRPAEEVITYL